jgi:hypothetical protein
MPAPQASMMKQLARLKFSSNALRVPQNWKEPAGNPGADHYGRAFKPNEKVTTPATTAPPLFIAASMNKYHTDTQKKLTADFGGFIDGACDAICGAWGQWQTAATMVGIVINAVTAMGGQIVGPPWTPLLLAQLPKSTPMQLKYSNVIANVLGTAWLTFTSTVKVTGMPWYPAFAAVPSPVAPPVPNVPCPFAALTQVPVSISANVLKMQMVGQLGDPKAQYHQELFDAISDAFEKTYNLWKVSTMVTNVLGTGPVPTFAPPYVPVGPVVGGIGNMIPGGFT